MYPKSYLRSLWEKIKLAILSIIESCEQVIFYSERYSSLIIAFALIGLVFVTYFHMQEARELRRSSETIAKETKNLAIVTEKMATETKKLADSTSKMKNTIDFLKSSEIMAKETKKLDVAVEKMTNERNKLADLISQQIQPIPYPFLEINVETPTLKSKQLIEKISVINNGGVIAYHVNVFVCHVYNAKEKFKPILASAYKGVYKGRENATSLDFKRDIFPKEIIDIEGSIKFTKTHNLNSLQKLVVVIRFKETSDALYSYKESAYILNKNDDLSLEWKILSDDETESLTIEMIKSLDRLNRKVIKKKPKNDHLKLEKVTKFFQEYYP
jgi:hypothetical protein